MLVFWTNLDILTPMLWYQMLTLMLMLLFGIFSDGLVSKKNICWGDGAAMDKRKHSQFRGRSKCHYTLFRWVIIIIISIQIIIGHEGHHHMFSFRVCWFCIIWKQSFNKINWDTPEVDKTKPPCLWENVPKNTHLVKHPKTSWCYKQTPNTKTKTNKYQIFSLESAGSVSVAFHLLSPLSRDLFTR